jgi:hypothetical protein
MKKTERKAPNKIIILSVAIGIIALMTGLVFIYKPFTDRTTSLRSEILRERDKNILIGKIRVLGKHMKFYDKRIPKDASVSWLIGELSELASKEHVELSSMTPGSPEDYEFYAKLYVIMDTISTYHELGRFLSRVESSDKFLRVENIYIKRLDTDELFGKTTTKFKMFDVKANIIVSTVMQKE